jgi:Transposase and inactivated derivatives
MNRTNKIILDGFYPESLKITKVTNGEKQITIELKSHKHSHQCRKCGEEMTDYHGTYIRTVQDLPILGKSVKLRIYAYEYYCKNAECGVASWWTIVKKVDREKRD